MLGTMPITVRVVPDKDMYRKRPAPAATESLHLSSDLNHDDDGSIPIAKRLHLERSHLGNGDSNQNAKQSNVVDSINGRLLGVLPNGVHVSQLNGNKVPTLRRKASMNAQVALELMMDESPPVSPTESRNDVKTEAKSTAADGSYTATLSKPVNGHADTAPNISFEKSISPGLDDYDSESLETTPVSSPFYRLSPQRLFDATAEGEGLSLATFYQKGKLKQPKIHLVKHQSKRRHVQKPKSKVVSHNSLYSNVLQGGYVKRMASLNAAACVSAMMEPQKKSTVRHNGTVSKSTSQHDVTASSSAVVHPKQLDTRHSSLSDASKVFDPSLQLSNVITTIGGKDQLMKVPVTSALYLSDYSDEEEDEMPVPTPIQPCSLEDLPFVSIGLLHNGSTIHPDTRVFYKSDKNLRLSLPARITPVLVPSNMVNVRRAIECAAAVGVRKTARKKTRKGNNGWYPMGDPIKSIQIKKGTTKVVRKYYTGIKRRHEEVFVRDSITVSSGDLEHSKPYVAKVASIWQETDHRLMVTLFWYYRPTEVDLNKTTSGVVPPEFHEKEILASQHHDDNSVACIEEKCYVLGLQEYCRYSAAIKNKFCFGAKSLVPEPPRQLQATTQQTSTSSNAVSQDYTHHMKKSSNSDLCTTPRLQELRNVDQNLVFLCYRGYNHIAGKLSIKSRTTAK